MVSPPEPTSSSYIVQGGEATVRSSRMNGGQVTIERQLGPYHKGG